VREEQILPRLAAIATCSPALPGPLPGGTAA